MNFAFGHVGEHVLEFRFLLTRQFNFAEFTLTIQCNFTRFLLVTYNGNFITRSRYAGQAEEASNAILVGFNVRADASARKVIEAESLDLRYYSVIYNLIDEVKAAMSGMLSPELKQQIIGLAEVRDVFKSPKFGAIAGCMVTEGVVKRHNPIRVLRDNVVIYEGELESLRRFKDDVNEVRNGMECGIGVKNYNDVRTGDVIEVFEIIEIQRTIA